MSDFKTPIVGEITPSDADYGPQRTAAELEELIAAAFDAGATLLCWHQYTPYFNDGEPCIFRSSAGERYYYIGADTLEAREMLNESRWGDDVSDEYPNVVGKIYQADSYSSKDWDNELRKYVDNPNFVKPRAYDEVLAVYDAIDSRAFTTVLLRNFGDHAEIMASRDSFEVEFYEHD